MKTKRKEDPGVTTARSRPLIGGVSRPVVSARRQLAVAVLDASESMHGSKIQEVIQATRDLHGELADPANRGAFDMAAAAYAERALVLVPVKAATEIRPEDFVVDVGVVGTFTSIGAGLARAQELIKKVAGAADMLRPIVVLLTDGQNNYGQDPEVVAKSLKQSADIVAVGFGADADMQALAKIATSPQHAIRCADGKALRAFFTHLGATMSTAIRSGADAASMLSGVMKG